MKKLKYFLAIILVLGVGSLAQAQTAVPRRFHFQSVFYDTGGNPLPSGFYLAKFAILDQSYNVVYTEDQEIELLNGVASTMVGDGFEEGSNLTTPTGGILRGVITPNQTYYLRAEVEGDQRVMEIGSVPYAHFSEEALSVSAGAVDGESIALGSIVRQHLSEELEEAVFGDIPSERIPDSVTPREDFESHINATSNAHPAMAISASGPFANANSANVEDVLKDLDRALELRDANLDSTETALETQINTVNTNLQNQINQERTERMAADSSLQSQVDSKLSLSGGAMSGIINMQGNRITSLAEPSGSSDAATRAYVDSAVDGLRTDLTAPSGGVQPEVAAAGVVTDSDSTSSITPSLSWGYNVSSVSGDTDPITGGMCTRVSFINSVSTPYVVQLTQTEGGAGAGASIYAISFSTSGFLACPRRPFHFTVFR